MDIVGNKNTTKKDAMKNVMNVSREQFYKKCVELFSSDENPEEMLSKVFSYIQAQLSLDGITIHQYIPQTHELNMLFLVTEKRTNFLGKIVTLPKDKAIDAPSSDERHLLIAITDVMQQPIAKLHMQSLKEHISMRERAYLIAMMRTENELIGHLCFMGNKVECFDQEAATRVQMLVTHFAEVVQKLLQSAHVQKHQKKIQLAYEENFKNQVEYCIGENGGLKKIVETVQQLENSEIPVLIRGETGTGKEVIADIIQRLSRRKDKPFIKINCGAIPETLIDSELFGYEKGAFTGAYASKPGRFELADGGTLFLDEIGDLPLQAQVRLLRVLQDGLVERLGAIRSLSVNVRIIAATNKNLEKMLQEGQFREDLYYRLNVLPMEIPPLRERREDISALIFHFIGVKAREQKMSYYPIISLTTHERLMSYSWPGNIRELENLIERSLTIYPSNRPNTALELETFLPDDESWYLEKENGSNYFLKLIDERFRFYFPDGLNGKIPEYPTAEPPERENQRPENVEYINDYKKNGSGIDKNLPQQKTLPQQTLSQQNLSQQNISQQNISQQNYEIDSPRNYVLDSLDDAMRNCILNALNACHWRISGKNGAAQILKINPNTLRAKMTKLGISIKGL